MSIPTSHIWPSRIFCVIFLVAVSAFAQRVVGVTDGDTIKVQEGKQQYTVRLAGIDAPEKTQDFGNRSKQNLSSLVYGKTVTLVGTKKDRYGRLVRKILLDGRDINLEQVKAGLAWHYKEYLTEQTRADRRLYSLAEAAARSAKLNLWSLPGPTPPWTFRHGPPVPAAFAGKIIGNKNSGIYHRPGCPGYTKVAEKNRVLFETAQKAEAAGFRAAKNCH